MNANRRDFIKYVVAGSVAAGCPVDLPLLAADSASSIVDSEDNRICHEVRDGKVFTRPPVSARHDVVIVGGGASGLVAAYLLRQHDFQLLEKEPHWGGNAYAMDYEGSTYGTGTAFLYKSEYGFALAKELGLEPLPINSSDGSILNGELISDTWGAGLDKLPYAASIRESFKKFKKEILAIDLSKRSDELYNIPLSTLLKPYPEELTQWWDAYGASNYGAVSAEAAAAVGVIELQELTAESHLDDRLTWPGGLGAFSKKLSEFLQSKFAGCLQSGATTVAVVPEKSEVQVTYANGPELKTVAAKAVIMAAPKFIARRIIEGLPEKQSQAMRQIHYIPYPVVNLIFDKPLFHHGYDTWCPGNAFTDFVVADWVVRDHPGYQQKFNILTCYTPMRAEQRAYLLTDEGARKIAQNVLHDFWKLFPGSNVDPIEVHIYRRGHPLFKSSVGVYTQVQPRLRQPMDRIFFANTDSEGPESDFNGAVNAARRTAKEVEARLAGNPIPKQATD